MASTEKRRRELARAKYLRQQQRRDMARQRMRRRNQIVAGVAAVVVIAAGGTWAGIAASGGGKSTTAAAASASPSAAASASASASPAAKAGSAHVAGCTTPAPGSPNKKQWKKAPATTIDTAATYTATINTNCGALTVKLDAAKAPVTVNNFAFLAGQKYFDHVKCHRLTVTGLYMMQCGDPTGTGTGGPGYTFKDENLSSLGKKNSQGLVTYPAGTVAMANSGPNTNGSQFFIVYLDSPLPPNYTPFGTVTSGLDSLKKVAAAGTDNHNGQGDGAPLQTYVMNSVTVAKS